MAEERSDKSSIPPPETPRVNRDRRGRLPVFVRYLIVALFGSLAAIIAFVLLRTIGY